VHTLVDLLGTLSWVMKNTAMVYTSDFFLWYSLRIFETWDYFRNLIRLAFILWLLWFLRFDELAFEIWKELSAATDVSTH